MKKGSWIDVGLGALGVALTAVIGTISAYVSPSYRDYLYALCAATAVVAVAQTARATTAALRHGRDIAELRAGQDYLAQPESYRQMKMLFQQHAALQEADERFREHFKIDSRKAEPTIVVCKTCGWRTQQALE